MTTTSMDPRAPALHEEYLKREVTRLLPYKDVQISTGMPGMVRVVIFSQHYNMDVPIGVDDTRGSVTELLDSVIEMIRHDLPWAGMEWQR